METMEAIYVHYKGKTSKLDAIASGASLYDLQKRVEDQLHVPVDTQRLFHNKRRISASQSTPLADVCDLTQDVHFHLVAGASKRQIEQMNSTQEETRREEHIRANRKVVSLADRNEVFGAREAVKSNYRFHNIEPLEGFSDTHKAREILEQLANDRGVLAVLHKHKWSVGSLAEMKPDGKVGVDPVCVLGLNQNSGQKILLRLRTDDLQGFRKILSIKKVLYHELAHNKFSEHNNDFYMLMRQVEKEANELDWTQASGRALGGGSSVARIPESGPKARDGHRLGGNSKQQSRLLQTPATETANTRDQVESVESIDDDTKQATNDDNSVANGAEDPVASEAKHSMSNEAVNAVSNKAVIEDATTNVVLAPVDMSSVQEEVMDFDDLPISDRERRIHTAVAQLRAQYGSQVVSKAVQLLHKIVSNILAHPGDDKFKSLRKSTRVFSGNLAIVPACLEFLIALGFEDQSDRFVLQREDPALLWIGRSSLEMIFAASD